MADAAPASSPVFAFEPHASPVLATERAARLVEPGFGQVFTDHMAVVHYSAERGWHEPVIRARAPLTMDPASAVLHYAQEIFEGLKAYRWADGSVWTFRPEATADARPAGVPACTTDPPSAFA